MTRAQKEILDRFNDEELHLGDFFSAQKEDLICYMTFNNAKQFLKEDFVKKVDNGKEKWKKYSNPKKEILDYLDFAYMKAEDERGLSACRSLLHLKTWIWLEDKEFYDKIIDEIENYYDYGLPVLKKISKHYGHIQKPYVWKE